MEVNYIAVLVSGILNMVVGFVWYGPLFSKPWMKGNGFKKTDIEAGPGIGYLFTFIAAMLSAVVTDYLVNTLNITSLSEGLLFGAILGGGYVATTFLTNYIFSKKTFSLYLIDAGYQVLMITLVAGVCTLMN